MIRPIAILLATTVTACAQEATTPIWPGTPEFKPLWSEPARKKPQVRAWVRHSPPARTIIKRDVVIVKPQTVADVRCKPYVAAIGDSAKSEAAARLEAQAAWKATTQFMYGNMYLDLQYADNLEYQCGPSSVPKFGGLIEQAASKILPIESYRCRISAQPCAVPVVREETGK